MLNLASAIAGLAVCCVGKADLRQPGEPFALSQRTCQFIIVTGRLGAGSCEERGLFGLEWILARSLRCFGKQDVVRGTEVPGQNNNDVCCG